MTASLAPHRTFAAASPAADPARLEIQELWTRPAWIPVVAAWLHGEWFRHIGLSMADLQVRLQARPGLPTLPRTFVGADAEGPAGAFSLTEGADPRTALPTLCLANLFVPPPLRRRGLGRQLCLGALEEARRWQIPQLCLITISHAAFYESLGWERRGVVSVVSGGLPAEGVFMKRNVEPLSMPDQLR